MQSMVEVSPKISRDQSLFDNLGQLSSDRSTTFLTLWIQEEAMEAMEISATEMQEIFGNEDSDQESFYGFEEESDSLSDSEEEDGGGGGGGNPFIGAYDYSDWLREFTKESGIRCELGDNPTELNFFLKVLSNKLFVMMAVETDRYAAQEIARMRVLQRLHAEKCCSGKQPLD